jgi:2-amino-4-hydroxy-6-hydroxymethyldihydropteridine diphosphokinase
MADATAMAKICIGLGSNQGDREGYLRRAAIDLTAAGIMPLSISAIYESAAHLPPDAPANWDQPFLNQVIVAETRLEPLAVLDTLLAIEDKAERVRTGHWAPRTLDLDLLAYENETLAHPRLTLPHPLAMERDFVVVPWSDIAPEWVIKGRSVLSHRQARGFAEHAGLRCLEPRAA